MTRTGREVALRRMQECSDEAVEAAKAKVRAARRLIDANEKMAVAITDYDIALNQLESEEEVAGLIANAGS